MSSKASVATGGKSVRFADGRRAPTPIERSQMNLSEEDADESSIIDTNMLLDRLREAAAAAEATLAAEAAEEELAAAEAEEELKRRAFLGVPLAGNESSTPHIDAVVAASGQLRMEQRFSELDSKLAQAEEAVEQVAAVYASAVADGVFDKSTTEPYTGSDIRLPRFWAGQEERLSAVKKELTASGRLMIKSTRPTPAAAGLNGEDEKGIISEFVSEVTGRRARTAAAQGQIRVLATMQAERDEWATYLTLSSWDLQCPLGNTALLLACQHGHLACAESLLAWGADPCLANSQGATPLHVAASRPIAELLLSHGADPAALDKLRRTPYMVAKSCHLGSHGEPRAEVIFAFGPNQQLTSNRKGEIIAPSEEEVREMLLAEARERADRLYHQGLGALALGQFEAAIFSFKDSLAEDPDAPCSDAARDKLAAAERQMAVLAMPAAAAAAAAAGEAAAATTLARLSSL